MLCIVGILVIGGYFIVKNYHNVSEPVENSIVEKSQFPCSVQDGWQCFGDIDKVAVDFSGDGNTSEATLYSTSTKTERGVAYFFNIAGVTYDAPVPIGASRCEVKAVDLNKDGKEELLISCGQDGTGGYSTFGLLAKINGKIRYFYSEFLLPNDDTSLVWINDISPKGSWRDGEIQQYKKFYYEFNGARIRYANKEDICSYGGKENLRDTCSPVNPPEKPAYIPGEFN